MMQKYRVMLEGRNFLIETDGRIGKFGFFQTLFLEAESPTDAENAAVQKVRNNPDVKASVRNAKDDPPMIHMEELEEVQAFPADCRPETGRGWYSEDEEEGTSNRVSEVTARKIAEPQG